MSETPPLPENESSMPCPPASLSEMAAFYQELHTPTKGQTVIRQLMHKLLVFSAREVDHRGGCLILKDTGISLLIPPGNRPWLASPHVAVQTEHYTLEGASFTDIFLILKIVYIFSMTLLTPKMNMLYIFVTTSWQVEVKCLVLMNSML